MKVGIFITPVRKGYLCASVQTTERNAVLSSAKHAQNRYAPPLTQLNALEHNERRRKIEETYQVEDNENSC